MAYCPNCAEQIASDAAECPVCKAIFEGQGSWQPIASPPKAVPLLATSVRIGVLVAVWAAVVFLLILRTSFPSVARKLFEMSYMNPFAMPDFSLGLLGLGVGLLAADFAARPFELGTFHGTITLTRFAELVESPWTRFALCTLAFPGTLLIPFCAFFTLVVTMRSLSSLSLDVVALFLALGLGGLIGILAIASGVLLPHERFRSSKKLYWLTLCGLIVAIVTAFPLAQIGPVLAWPLTFLLAITNLFILHYTIVGIFLILALLGGRQRRKEGNSCTAPFSAEKA